MSSHIIHVVVDLDDGWTEQAKNAALFRIAENIAEEVEANWGQHGAFTMDYRPTPYVTEVRAFP